jgi:asparagine synthetase B (glutamine-hydrolysing)
MIEDRDYCMSSFLTYRTVIDQTKCFSLKYPPRYTKIPENRVQVHNSDELYKTLKNQVEELCKNHKVALALSGGIDSAVLAKFMPKGSTAYTFQCIVPGKEVTNEVPAAQKYAKECGLNHKVVKIYWEDMEKYAPLLMKKKGAPIHSIEVQIYKAAMMARADGVDLMIVGESSDLIFGGMDKLLAKDWQFDEFVKRYTFLDPQLVLTHPIDMSELFEKYRQDGDKIDFMTFMDEVFSIESSSSYLNAFETAVMPYYDPYAQLIMKEPLDLSRVRNGEPKYLIRALYAMKYPEIPVPDKIPMPRPVDMIFKDWEGPKRPEFRQDIPMEQLTGNQKWQLWCAEQFLNGLDG